MQNIHYRNYRLHGHSHPAVVSTTQQSLCLAPNRSGFLPMKKRLRAPTLARRKCESAHAALPFMTSVATVISSTDVAGTPLPPSPTPPTLCSLPVTTPPLHRQRLSHKQEHLHSLPNRKLAIRYKPPTPPTSAKISPPLQSLDKSRDKRAETIRAYRAQLQSYFAPRRNNVSLIGRKMTPVLRSSNQLLSNSVKTKLMSEKDGEESEATSQKRVRFSDQLGFPLVRNMTPNYRRKHSYILRWLETAGRTSQALM